VTERGILALLKNVPAPEQATSAAAPLSKGMHLNTHVGYIICVHRAASSIFGSASTPLNRDGAVLFFEDEGRARFERDLLNAHSMNPHVHHCVEPALNLTTPCCGYELSVVAQETPA